MGFKALFLIFMIKVSSGELYFSKDPLVLSRSKTVKIARMPELRYTHTTSEFQYLLLYYMVRILINQPVSRNNCTGNERNCNGPFALSSTDGDQLAADLDHSSR